MSSMSISEAVTSRRSVRAYLDKPVPLDVLQRVMDKARWSPSGCNFQPWEATILSGEPLKNLQEKMLAAPNQEPEEYAVTPAELPDLYRQRLFSIGAAMYAAQGIDRNDTSEREKHVKKNFTSYGAPAVLLCYFPRVMGPPQWSDVGMWLQTVMLLLREEGLDSCAQEFLSLHAKLIKDHLGVNDETHLFFCGIAIGYRDPDAPVNTFDRPRVPLDEQVKFIGF
jgi:nitroreductase